MLLADQRCSAPLTSSINSRNRAWGPAQRRAARGRPGNAAANLPRPGRHPLRSPNGTVRDYRPGRRIADLAAPDAFGSGPGGRMERRATACVDGDLAGSVDTLIASLSRRRNDAADCVATAVKQSVITSRASSSSSSAITSGAQKANDVAERPGRNQQTPRVLYAPLTMRWVSCLAGVRVSTIPHQFESDHRNRAVGCRRLTASGCSTAAPGLQSAAPIALCAPAIPPTRNIFSTA